jgi:hypothetical protein
MLRVVTVVQQIMRQLNDAVPEEDKIVAITKIVLNLMKHNGPSMRMALGGNTISSAKSCKTYM